MKQNEFFVARENIVVCLCVLCNKQTNKKKTQRAKSVLAIARCYEHRNIHRESTFADSCWILKMSEPKMAHRKYQIKRKYRAHAKLKQRIYMYIYEMISCAVSFRIWLRLFMCIF